MNILVLNGSPRQKGNTARLVRAFEKGAAGAGHSVSVEMVSLQNIKGCLACEYCHEKKPGECVQKDDMQALSYLCVGKAGAYQKDGAYPFFRLSEHV